MPVRFLAGTKRRRPTTAIGYGRTKRRRYNPKPLYRRRLTKKGYGRKSRRNAPLYRPVRLGHGQPVKALVKHSFNSNHVATFLINGFSVQSMVFTPMQGNNVMIGTAGTRPFPNNWVDMARQFSNVRVHGVKITAHFDDLEAGANDAFTSCFYSLPGPKDGTEPSASDPYDVTDKIEASQFLQEKQVRKKKFIGSGGNKNWGVAHNSGYWSIKRIQSELNLDSNVTELVVAADGTAVDSPDVIPQIIHKLVATRDLGIASAESISIRYAVTLYCEWYARRRVYEGTFTEA